MQQLEIVHEDATAGELREGDLVIWMGRLRRVAQISERIMADSAHPLYPIRFDTKISHPVAMWRGEHITRVLIEVPATPAPVQPKWLCICSAQGGDVSVQDCPVHDHSVDTENEAWRKRYIEHVDAQVAIAKRLGWTPPERNYQFGRPQ